MQWRSCMQHQQFACRQPSPADLLVPSRARLRARSVAAFSTQGSNDSSPLEQVLEWIGAASTNPQATELEMLQQGFEVCKLTGNITNWISVVAVSWLIIVSIAYQPVPPIGGLVLLAAAQLAGGAQLCWWLMYTAYHWRFKITGPLYGCCFVLIGFMLPLAYSYASNPVIVPLAAAALGVFASAFVRLYAEYDYRDKRDELKKRRK